MTKSVYILITIHLLPLIEFRVIEDLEPVPAATGRVAGYTLNRSLMCCLANNKGQATTQAYIHNYG